VSAVSNLERNNVCPRPGRDVRVFRREFTRRAAKHLVAIVAGAANVGFGHRNRTLLGPPRVEAPDAALRRRSAPRVLVPVARLDRAALGSIAYARSIAAVVTAIHITHDVAERERLREGWRRLNVDGDTDLVILDSPDRSPVAPLVAYIDALQQQDPERPTAVVLSAFVPRRRWEYLLRNQAALRLKLRLFFRPNTVVIDVPYHV